MIFNINLLRKSFINKRELTGSRGGGASEPNSEIKMPTYHFIGKETETEGLPGNRVSSKYLDGGSFDEALLFSESEKIFTIGEAGGSLIFVDRTRKGGLNKIHIGELSVKNPHVECYDNEGEEGPRADLHDFDVNYAAERLEELKRLRGGDYKAQLKMEYERHTWYSVEHRVKQLEISPEGLEQRIEEMEELVGVLKTLPKNTFIYDKTKEIESKTIKLIDLMAQKIRGFPEGTTRKEKRKPKIIAVPKILTSAEEIHTILGKVLDFITNHPHLDIERARHYWDEVDTWAGM